ncbi:MAG: tryptophan 2,3-dioxygenase [Planctomycetota bacterium]|jgi:tryptophan 2,3-dioxygenase
MPNDASKPVNYWEYIRVEELLGLQSGLAEDEAEIDNDEVLFITVHQVFELWFKLIRRELVSLREAFRQERVAEQELSGGVRAIRRICTLLRRCADHFEVMETLTTRDYLGFRDKLMPASGFQSAQLRQIEILLGLGADERIPLGTDESWLNALRSHDGSESTALRNVLAQRDDGPSLRDAVEEWLLRTPIGGHTKGEPEGEAALERFVVSFLEAQSVEVDKTCDLAHQRSHSDKERARLSERYEAEKEALRKFLNPEESEGGARRRRIRASMMFILSYRELPLLAWPREVLDGLIELEQLFVIFRQRHARMVERVIGGRTGTGGSSGVKYLDETALTYRIFRDLWEVRSHQVRSSANPPVENEDFYAFRNG